MNHLSGEQLVEQFYAEDMEAAERDRQQRHLESCAECAAKFAALKSDLKTIALMDVPEPDAGYGEQVWSRLRLRLPARPVRAKEQRAWGWAWWRGLAYAAAGAALVVGGFYFGRVWEHRQPQVATAAKTPAPAKPQVVVVVLGDHLDRSERLLVELKHADAESEELVTPLRDEARGLLVANRVFRENAEKTGDPELTEVLDHLDRLLTEIAQGRDGMDAAALTRLKDEMNADGLLFEVRVLRSKNPHRNSSVHVIAKGGTA